MGEPSPNDVLSGRGVSFNRHPGNEHFRTLLDAQSDAYGSGTKKQKMAISKSIVEQIYTMEPPGRFLKKCPETGEWEELPFKEAATRTSQAMAYTVRERAKQENERRRSPRQPSRKGGAERYQQPVDGKPRLPSYVKVENTVTETAGAAVASASGGEVGKDAAPAPKTGTSDVTEGNTGTSTTANSSLQQQLLQLRQSGASFPPALANSGAPLNDLLPLLAQARMQQQQQQLQQQQALHQLLGLSPLGLQSQLQSPLSIPTHLLPSQSTLLQNNSNLLHQASALSRGSTLMDSPQQSNLLQNRIAGLQSSPLNTQSLLSLIGALQNNEQPPAPAIIPQLPPLLAQQLTQIQQSQLNNQAQLNQLLASLIAPTNPLVLQQQQQQQQLSQPLNLLQQYQNAALLQQMTRSSPPNSANPNTSTEAKSPSSNGKKAGDDGEQSFD